MPAEYSRDKLATRNDSRTDLMSIVDSLRSIIQALRVSSRESEQKLGLTSAQLFILEALRERPAMSVNDLAARTYTHQSSVSMVVNKLVASNLVTRSSSGTDGRRLSLSLTSSGRAVLRKSPSAAQTNLVAALKSMPRSELKALAVALDNLTSRIAEQNQLEADSPRSRMSSRR